MTVRTAVVSLAALPIRGAESMQPRNSDIAFDRLAEQAQDAVRRSKKWKEFADASKKELKGVPEFTENDRQKHQHAGVAVISPRSFTGHNDAHSLRLSPRLLEAASSLETSVFTNAYRDQITRFLAPADGATIARDAVLLFDGAPQPIASETKEVPLADVPPESLMHHLGSRCGAEAIGHERCARDWRRRAR